jgi:hypothetical protein
MLKTFLTIFKKPFYLIITLVIFSIVSSIALLLPNIQLIIEIGKSFGALKAISTSFSLLGSIQTNFTVFSAIYTLLIGLFFGINISLFVFYLKKFKKMRKSGGMKTNTFGLIIGAFGIGCASCGSLVLVSVFSFLGLGGVFALLPFGGEEFAVIGLILLLISTYYLLKKIHKPMTCSVE